MGKNCILLVVTLLLLIFCSSVSASPVAKIVSGVVSNVASLVFKWLWSLNSTSKTAVSTRSMMKFESGYTVETVFDGSKVGIEPYSVQVSSDGDFLVLDYQNSNIHKITSPLSRYSRPKLAAGSTEGYTGHVDGKLREARMNHPKGLATDDSGNVYIADTMNMAIRKITDTGIVTIAGGHTGRGGGHIDGPSEDAKFSTDFDVVYVRSSCSLLIVDRGNQAIREIQLHEDDCSSSQDEENLHLGIAVLAAACVLGYLLAILQRRIGAMFSNNNEDPNRYAKSMPLPPYRKHPHKSVRPPLIPSEDDYDKQDEGLLTAMGKLFANTGSSFIELFGGLFTGFRKKTPSPHHSQNTYHHQFKQGNGWPLQESFVIPHEEEPPPFDRREPTPRKSYPFTSNEVEPKRQPKHNRSYYSSGEFYQQPQRHVQQLQHHQMHHPSSSETYYEPQNGETNEIVFGAVQVEGGQKEPMVIKAMDYADPSCYNNNNHNVRSRYNHMSYPYGY